MMPTFPLSSQSTSATGDDQPLYLQTEIRLPRAYIHCTRYADKKPFTQFAVRANRLPGWRSYELEASHSPNVTAPVALMEVFQQNTVRAVIANLARSLNERMS